MYYVSRMFSKFGQFGWDRNSFSLEVLKSRTSTVHGRKHRRVFLLFRPPLVRKKNYPQLVFFIQSIFADRYIHCRELRVVSSESFSGIEFEYRTFLILLILGVTEV